MANSYTNTISQLDKEISELSRNRVGNTHEIAKCQIRKINLAVFKGDFTTALNWINDAKKSVAKNSVDEAELLDAEGELYFRVSDLEIAQQKWNQSMAIKKTIPGLDSIYIAQGLARLARIASFNIEIDKAYQLSLQAVQILQRHTEKIAEINAGEIYREYVYALKISLWERPEGRYQLALVRKEYLKAIEYSEQSLGVNNYYIGQLLHDIGNTFNDETYNYRFKPEKINEVKKHVDSANIYYDSAIKYNRQYFDSSDRISVTYFVKGLLLQTSFLQDSFKTALHDYNQSISELVPSFKPTSLFDNPLADSRVFNKASVLQNVMYKGRLLIELYKVNQDTSLLKYEYQQFQSAEGWYKQLVTTYKSKEFNLIGGLYDQVPYPYLANITVELYNLTKDKKYIPEIYRNLELKNYYSILTKTLDKNNQIKNDASKAVTPSETVQQKLDGKTAILEFFDGDKYVAVITHANIEFVETEFKHVQELRTAIQQSDFKAFKSLAYETYLKGFFPLKQHLSNIEHVIIVPSSTTGLLPFDALLTDTLNCKSFGDCKSKYLINDYTFQHEFSSSIWAREKEPQSKVSLLAFAPSYSKHATLHFNQELIKDLQSKFWGTYYLNAQATKSGFLFAANNDSNIIHLAAHGDADLNSPELSKLIFTGENDTSNLGFADIAQLHFNSPLIVLAACKTQMGKNFGGEGLLNFPRAFALAGSRSIISSLWSVDDKATSILLGRFYKYLDKGMGKSEALRQSKLNYLNSNEGDAANPLYWSGIIKYGNDAPLQINRRQNWGGVLFALGMLSLLAIYSWRKFISMRDKALG